MKRILFALLLTTTTANSMMVRDDINFCDSTFNAYYIKSDGDSLKEFHTIYDNLTSAFSKAGFAVLDRSLVIQLTPLMADLHYDLNDFSVLIRVKPHEKTCILYVFDDYSMLTHVKLYEVVKDYLIPQACVVNFIVKPQDKDIQHRVD